MGTGIDGKQWTTELIDFQQKSTLHFITSSPSNQPSVDILPTARGVRTSVFKPTAVAPAPSPPSAPAHRTGNVGASTPRDNSCPAVILPDVHVLYLGLHYVKVDATGMHEMVLNSGPYHHVPLTPMLKSSTPFKTLQTDHVQFLRDVRQHSPNLELGVPASLQVQVSTQAADRGVDRDQDDKTIVPRVRQPVNDPRPLLQRSSSGPSAAAEFNSEQKPEPLTVELSTFTSSFNRACCSLAKLLGTSCDLQPTNLTNLSLLPYGQTDWVLSFHVVRMSTKNCRYAPHNTIRWLPFKAFEILHHACHTRPEGQGWPRRWLSRQPATPLTDRESRKENSVDRWTASRNSAMGGFDSTSEADRGILPVRTQSRRFAT